MKQTLINWIASDKVRMQALRIARELELPDWSLAAGFVRNLVWDKTHGYQVASPLNDIDLIYFDPSSPSESTDKALESKLLQHSCFPWSVKNQARMHQRNNDLPYQSSTDAMRYWPEVETAIGAWLNDSGSVELITPFGLDALFSKTVTINKYFFDIHNLLPYFL